jgi:murein DD-endopeptidase MepM/ murein hydrolase activator NlpD
MTETVRRFPRSTRVAVVAALLGVVSLVTTVAGAAPSKEDVERARARLEAIEDKLSGIQRQLAATQGQLNAATARVERREAAVEQVTAELILTQEQLDRARASYERVSTRLNERAAAAYMTGPASSIDFLLNAQNVADLTDRIAYVDALAQADAELAVKVANEKNRLVALEAELEEEQLREVRELERARAEKAEVVALFDEQQSLLSTQQQLLVVAERAFKRTEQSYEDWLAEQQASTGDALGGRDWQGGSLAPFEHIFEVCPVRQPRAYGDGFGAPRYAGGYHLHKGVDIVAPEGTEILAPFDGQAFTSSNGLGGNVVFVAGSQGTAYNAHLSRYSVNSSGSVSAGEVIGYVGNTGSSTTPHDHFEFHPHTTPGGGDWYKSSYGYGVIEDAINPYPLLLQACG